MDRKYSGNPTMMDEFKNFIGVLVSIFYWHSVVGGFVNCTGVIYGAGTHSARRYGALANVNNYKTHRRGIYFSTIFFGLYNLKTQHCW